MAGGMANVMRYAGATETGEKGRSREKSEAHRLWVILRGFSTPGSASLNVEGGSQGWKPAGVGNEREPRGGATEGGAPIHQRPSTLAFPPLSFFSTVRAPSFRVTSALFRPPFPSCFLSASETELLYPPRSVSAVGEQGAAFRLWRHPCRRALLIALSEFITEALVRGLPEFRY